MTTICVMIDHIFLDTEYRQPALHQHLAKHIIISLSDDLLVTFEGEKTVVCKGVIIDANILHTVASKDNRMLVFLIDDTSVLAQNIDRYQLSGKPYTEIPNLAIAQILEAYNACLPDCYTTEYAGFFNSVFSLLNLNYKSAAITDSRIQTALDFIMQSVDIDGATISRLCESAHLSQSRFSHLFKEQTGVSLNSYLALSKLRKAYQTLLQHGNITEAAMDAGFSTPSHFSAASKKYLGIAASELTGQCKLYFIND